MTSDAGLFKNRYLSSKYVDFWMADKGMEAGRNVWRQRLLYFLPFEPADSFRLLDLGTGTGALSLEILSRYPNVSLTCLDFSEAMLSHARERLEKFKEKVTFVQTNLQNSGWSKAVKGSFDAVVSSFVTHTIPDKIKAVYRELFTLIESEGCVLSCDVFPPPGPVLERIYHKSRLVDRQYGIKMKTGVEKTIPEVEQLLRERRAGYKAFFNADDRILAVGSPTVMNHLEWLKEAGFDEVDCLEKHTRSAIIGGFKHNH
ncbi:MAG: class I SAM-dependent methyltransferase [Candidatus Bathyarchaeia archaeon]